MKLIFGNGIWMLLHDADAIFGVVLPILDLVYCEAVEKVRFLEAKIQENPINQSCC